MSEVFELDHDRLAADPAFAALAGALCEHTRIDSTAAFNRYCRDACRAWRELFGATAGMPSEHFRTILERIERRDEDTIQTSWGGVMITLHEPPRVEKYLLVVAGGYLALEKHAEKDEHLEVREGAGLLLSRHTPGGPLLAEAIAPGGRFHFTPGVEHCLMGTDNLLVFERSTDPRGMDQDLIFLYEPDTVHP